MADRLYASPGLTGTTELSILIRHMPSHSIAIPTIATTELSWQFAVSVVSTFLDMYHTMMQHFALHLPSL